MIRELSNLAAQQRWLASLILEPDAPGIASASSRAIAGGAPGTLRSRLAAYAGGYPARLYDALDEAYPAVRTIVGRDAFAALSARYRTRVPRGAYSLTEAGRNLPEFLASDELTKRLPFLGDLAALEWRVLVAFHAFEKPVHDPASLAGWSEADWSEAGLEFQPSVAVVESRWPILDLWSVRDTPRGRIDVEIEGRPQRVLVRRDGYDVCCDLMDPLQAGLLSRLLAGETLGTVMEGLTREQAAAEVTAIATEVANWFGAWTRAGMVAACRKVREQR